MRLTPVTTAKLALTFSFLVGILTVQAIAGDAAPSGNDKAPLGSPQFYPSPERPIGWRGDWTGRYPAANPVTEWGYWPKSPNWGLRFQLKRPAKDDAGKNATEVTSGELLEWLVLGPFEPKDAAKALDEEFLPKEADLSPDEGEKAGDLAWTKHVSANKDAGVIVNTIRLDTVAKGKPNGIVYAHCYLFSQTKGKIEFYLDQGKSARIWVNSKTVHNNPAGKFGTPGLNYVCYAAGEHWSGELLMLGRNGLHVPVELEKGWNRVLIKADSQINLHLVETSDVEYEKKNVAWVTKLPNWSNAMPIIVGDKIFLMAEPDELICINKQDGKILWSRRTTFVDATSPDDKKRFSQFKELEALNDSLKKTEEMGKRVEIRQKMLKLLKDVDEENKKTNPDYLEIYKLQAVLKDAGASEDAKSKTVAEIRKKLSEMKCPREINPLYQVIEPLEERINAPDTKPEDREAIKKKFHEYLSKLGPKPMYPFHPSSHVGGIGFACPTPVSDGKNVYVFINGFGIAGCYDLSGNLKWARLVTDMGDAGAFHNNTHVLAEGKMVVLRGSVLRAFEAETGKVLWTSTDLRKGVSVDMWHGFGTGASFSSSPCVCKIGSTTAIFFNTALVRLSDGKVLAQMHMDLGGNVRATPFPDGDAVYLACQFAMTRIPMPAEAKEGIVLSKSAAEKWQSGDVAFYSSPVLHDGMLYGMRNDGRIWAFEANPVKDVYLQDPQMGFHSDYDHVGDVASVALGGKNLYAFNNQGVGVVFEPGKTFKQVARNRLAYCVDRIWNYDPEEIFNTGPIFEGERMYIRGEQNLYCIGAK